MKSHGDSQTQPYNTKEPSHERNQHRRGSRSILRDLLRSVSRRPSNPALGQPTRIHLKDEPMNQQQRAKMYIKGYRFRIRETDASHIGVGEPICVKTIGNMTHLFRSVYPDGIFEIDDILADGSTVPLSTIKKLHQRAGSTPSSFNPEFRWGFGEAVSAAYESYCETCLDQTPGPSEERAAEYKRIADRLRPRFPAVQVR